MKRLAFILMLVFSAGPAGARGCSSMCHFFDAWALTQLCPNLIFNNDGRSTDKGFGDMRSLKQAALKLDMKAISEARDICHPACFKLKGDEQDGTPCQYLQTRAVTPDE